MRPRRLKTKVEDFAKKFEPVGRRFGIGGENPFETGNFERINENLRFRFGGSERRDYGFDLEAYRDADETGC